MSELAASSISMLSARADGREELRRGRSIPAVARMFAPERDDLVLEHIGAALGNLANHSAARAAMKDAGLPCAIARLLRLQHRPRAQVAAAVSLALLAAKDVEVQDSARYLGAVPYLVNMIAFGDTCSEVGRLAVLALRHQNPVNEAEIVNELRNSSEHIAAAHPRGCLASSVRKHAQLMRLNRLLDDLEDDMIGAAAVCRPHSASPTCYKSRCAGLT